MASSLGYQPLRNQRTIFSFITPAETERISYSANQRSLSSALQQHRWFQDGTLLDTFEKGGIHDVFLSDGEPSRHMMYPVVHLVDVQINHAQSVPLLNENTLGPSFTLQQGLYTKIKQFRPFPENSSLHRSNDSRAFIVLGFKTLEFTFNDMLEDMWKDWTGARAIYLNLPDDLGLSQVSFYRRLAPKELGIFMYILMVQCENVTRDNRWMLLDYVQRLRVEKMMGYMSAYREESTTNHNGGSEFDPETEINGLLPNDDYATTVDI